MLKICAKCANLMRLEPMSSPRYDVWYNLICKASPLAESVDLTTGGVGYKKVNDLGTEYYTENPYEYCREVNTDGECSKFYPTDDGNS